MTTQELLAGLSQMTEEQKNGMLSQITEALSSVNDTLRTQAACSFVAQEQEAAGLPNASIGYILQAGLIMLAFVVLGAACSIAVGYLSRQSHQWIRSDLAWRTIPQGGEFLRRGDR